jgi:hypothetical protein
MPRAGFYNDNEYREYPFVFKSVYAGPDLPTAAVVDCGFIMGIDSGFDEAQHTVYLASISKTATVIRFEFRTTASNAAAFPIVFEREFNADDWTDEYAESAVVTAGVFCATEPAWSGFMVSGRMSEITAAMAVGETRTFLATGEWQRVVEPARVQSLVKSYLRSINVANYARTVISDCATTSPAPGNRAIVVNATCIKGDIRFQPGFNCRIRQSDTARELQISAERGINTTGPGAAEFCQNGSEIKLAATEVAPVGSQFLSGGPACDEVITSINGLQAADVKIVGGSGIQVVADPEQANTIQIKRVDNLISPTC